MLLDIFTHFPRQLHSFSYAFPLSKSALSYLLYHCFDFIKHPEFSFILILVARWKLFINYQTFNEVKKCGNPMINCFDLGFITCLLLSLPWRSLQRFKLSISPQTFFETNMKYMSFIRALMWMTSTLIILIFRRNFTLVRPTYIPKSIALAIDKTSFFTPETWKILSRLIGVFPLLNTTIHPFLTGWVISSKMTNCF